LSHLTWRVAWVDGEPEDVTRIAGTPLSDEEVGYGHSAEPLIEEILARVPSAVAEVAAKLPAGFPQRVADTIFAGLQSSATRLAAMRAQ
jgi:hypothetical protein